MNRTTILILFLATISLTSCTPEVVHIFSEDRSQCISIITDGDLRFIVNGDHNEITEGDYVAVSIENIDPLGDAFHVCWKENGKWEAVNHRSIILKSTLDTSKYQFNNKLPDDNLGVPTEIKFRQPNCAVFDFYRMRLSPNTGAIVKIE